MNQVQLTDEERQLFEFIVRTVNEKHTGTVMRVAGGWVRDKLLSKYAHDIDISVDNLSGKEFGLLLKEAAPTRENKKRKLENTKVAVIEIRPDEGKFVETTTIHIFNFSLDLLALRSQQQLGEESNSELDHQINPTKDPLIESRLKAAEDAHLRDFTINALFYNIESQQVEDYVGVRNFNFPKLGERFGSLTHLISPLLGSGYKTS
jgi:tRNA nucleotidyltransferase (CCA-adding enzyme)